MRRTEETKTKDETGGNDKSNTEDCVSAHFLKQKRELKLRRGAE